MNRPALIRLIGGTPAAVAVRLTFTSLLAGAVLTWFDIEPLALYHDLQRVLFHLWVTGFGALGGLGHLFAVGAGLVLPIWAAVRILSFLTGRSPSAEAGPLPGSPPQDVRSGRKAWPHPGDPSGSTAQSPWSAG